eukprot:scaffold16235_cov50-Phaeocystis_antarctica.AAC.1
MAEEGWATAVRASASWAARGSCPKPSSSHSQRRRRPRCPPTRNGSTACWHRTRSMRPAESSKDKIRCWASCGPRVGRRRATAAHAACRGGLDCRLGAGHGEERTVNM